VEKQEMIGYDVSNCVLGTVLVATSERGVCAILLGSDASKLVDDLRRRFPRAELIPGVVAPEHVAKVAELIASPQAALDLPLDLRGSDFERLVWRALREIPAGATQTYGEVAQRIGAPQSAKEVGEACAANPLAVAIPCHRVLRKDGGLAGYRWGVKRKRALLEREGARLAETADLFAGH
jgi:AraC family transcriptional regulator, regulatory protein of adaptative response / methylated-DNA-[protein]-cysteine methyltransferase